MLHIPWRELELPTRLTHSQVPVWVTALSPPIQQPGENHPVPPVPYNTPITG